MKFMPVVEDTYEYLFDAGYLDGAYKRWTAAKNSAVGRSEIDARLRNRVGELGGQWVDRSVVQSPVSLRLDQQPVPVAPGKRRDGWSDRSEDYFVDGLSIHKETALF